MESLLHKPNRRLLTYESLFRLRLNARTTYFPTSTFTTLATATLCLVFTTTTAAQDRGWEFTPYRIRAMLAIDVAGGRAERLSAELPRYLSRRVEAAIGPAWAFDVQLVDGVSRQEVFAYIGDSTNPPTEFAKSSAVQQGDKLLLLALRESPDGFELTAREFDVLVERWGTLVRRQSRQADMLAEQMFALVWEVVAPVARLELDSSDEGRVLIHLRGSELLRARPGVPPARPAEVYLPILRRTTRSGELAESGIQVVPWTYIETTDVEGKIPRPVPVGDRERDSEMGSRIGTVVGRVRSANRRPLSGGRRGRVEQVAIAIRSDPGPTELRLQSRSNADKPLVGYQVFEHKEGDEPVLIGSSDPSGHVVIPSGDARIATVLVKHGGHLLARLPVVPGADPKLDVPLPDDEVRLAAESRLAALREELVDVVARRNILMARVRQKISQKDYSAAQDLLRTLDELPGRSQFNLTITTTARALRSDDPQIQRRIDQLFEATQTALVQYLDPRPITNLHDELMSARAK